MISSAEHNEKEKGSTLAEVGNRMDGREEETYVRDCATYQGQGRLDVQVYDGLCRTQCCVHCQPSNAIEIMGLILRRDGIDVAINPRMNKCKTGQMGTQAKRARYIQS